MAEVDIWHGKGYGFRIDKGIYLVRCFECGAENYMPSVASGICAWCGYNANHDAAVANADPVLKKPK